MTSGAPGLDHVYSTRHKFFLVEPETGWFDLYHKVQSINNKWNSVTDGM